MALELKAWRKAKGFTQSDMAKNLGIHTNTYIKYENNPQNITMGMANDICTFLGVDLDDVIFLPKTATDMLQ